MTKYIPVLLLILASASSSAQAQGILGGILKRRPEPTPNVPELINQLQDADQARSRSAAADNLRQFDAKQHPQAIRALIHSLEHDINPTVRADAAQALGRAHPVTQAAGQALERASAKDPAFKVRFQAWTSLKSIQLRGYRNQGPSAVEDYIVNAQLPASPSQQKQKSLFDERPPSIPLPSPPVAIAPPPNNNLVITEPEPAQYIVPRPLPVGTPWSTAVPSAPRRIAAPEIFDDAPSITPPPPTPLLPPLP